jgi:quercetin dioxygenase-like cupin family protein
MFNIIGVIIYVSRLLGGNKMFVGNISDLERVQITSKDANESFMKVLISPKEGWEDYVMRVIEVNKGGYTPKHSHPWPHINYITEGEGQLLIKDTFHSVTAGSYAYVPSNSLHQFKNIGTEIFKFICIVPKEGHKY